MQQFSDSPLNIKNLDDYYIRESVAPTFSCSVNPSSAHLLAALIEDQLLGTAIIAGYESTSAGITLRK
jgi:hypothetical protein